MKPHSLELPFGKNHTLQSIPKIVLAIISFMFLFVAPLKPLLNYPLSLVTNITLPPPESLSPPLSYFGRLEEDSTKEIIIIDNKCDIFTGEWVPNSEAPYYTNTTCWAIHDHQNCMKYGRPDSEFMKWRWKPNDCELPIFDPAKFLELASGKSLAFVGDSVGRNQMQSLICLLSRVEYPVDISYTADDKSRRWQYSNNFTIANFWTPHLVKAREADPNGPTLTGLFNLYLDEFDLDWTTKIEEFDYVIISAGHWFFRPSMFFEGGHLMGCHYCLDKNVTDLSIYYGYRKAFRTTFKALNSLENFKGVTFLRTFSPSHFENGLWNEGGDCVRKRPFRSNETSIEGINLKLYLTQMEEFRLAEREGEKKGLKFRLLDTTQAMLLRPDGHPSRYGHWPNENVTLYNDCVHWCLPGPIDTWNDFLLEMLRKEGDSVQGKIHSDRIMKIE